MADRHSGQHHDRRHGTRQRRDRPPDRDLHCPVLGVVPEGYETARQAEKEELDRERIRFGMSRPPAPANSSSCPGRRHAVEIGLIGLVDLSLADLPGLTSLTCLPVSRPQVRARQHPDARASFAAEAEAIAAAQTRLTRLAPSRDETPPGPCCWKKKPRSGRDRGRSAPELEAAVPVQGPRARADPPQAQWKRC